MARVQHPQRSRARELRRQGQTLAQIASDCGVTKVAVSKWCRDLPEHAAATERNALASYATRKIFPRGTEVLNTKLRLSGVPFAERLRLTRQVADRDAGGRA